jgi:polar amino acid transport system substrate-binding protein
VRASVDIERQHRRATWTLRLAVLLLAGCAASGPRPDASARTELAPTGTLRFAFLANNPVQARRDALRAEYRGVALDMGHALADALGVAARALPYPNVTRILETATSGEWDVAFLAFDPARTTDLAFAVYMEGHNAYLVRDDSPIRGVADADRPGVRISVQARDAVDLHLTRTLKHATLVRSDAAGATKALLGGEVDAYAENVERLTLLAVANAGFRVVPGSVLPVQQAIAVPRARPAGSAYVADFVAYAKRSGLVATAISRAGLRGANVAP